MRRQKLVLGLGAVTLVIGLAAQAFLPSTSSAAQITARSLTLQAGATDGGSKPSGNVKHFFQFTLPNVASGNVGSILFKYCTTAASVPPPGIGCNLPAGLDTTGATLTAQSGAAFTSIVNTTNGAPYLTRAAAPISPRQSVTYQLSNIINPSADNTTFFVRISTYASTDTTGAVIDSGTVAASTSEPIVLTGTMPESLVFCTGATVGTTVGVPDCATATSGSIAFDRLFSPIDTAVTTSQMAASTNAGSGYVITVNGVTLTSGSNTISAMQTAAGGDAGVHGVSQFGLNLKANTTATSTPATGTEVAPAANGTNYRGEAQTGYSTVDRFRFFSGNTVAASTNGGAGGTDAQIFTATYIVNVPGSQPAGTYTTTLTYICTPTF